MQLAAQNAIDQEFPPGSSGPTASLVSIDNKTGEVRAMVSGDGNYESDPFNLATLGYRQPGSSFKIFTLVQALESGRYGPDSVINSHPLDISFKGPAGEPEHFIVHNDGDQYSGPISLADATDISDKHRLRPGRDEHRNPEHQTSGPDDGRSLPHLDQSGDDHRRPPARRVAPGHGPRL